MVYVDECSILCIHDGVAVFFQHFWHLDVPEIVLCGFGDEEGNFLRCGVHDLGDEDLLARELKFVALIDEHGFGDHEVIGVEEVGFHVPTGELLVSAPLRLVGEEDPLFGQ